MFENVSEQRKSFTKYININYTKFKNIHIIQTDTKVRLWRSIHRHASANDYREIKLN